MESNRSFAPILNNIINSDARSGAGRRTLQELFVNRLFMTADAARTMQELFDKNRLNHEKSYDK